MSSNIALGTLLEQAESCERVAQAERAATDVELAKANSGADELLELRKRQAASDVSVQELTAELKDVKA